MLLRFAVVGLRVGPKGAKATEVYLTAAAAGDDGGGGGHFHVADAALAAFCLPLGPEGQTLKDRMAPEEYSFTLTQGDGSRVQGFCRRVLVPPRRGSPSTPRYPTVLVLLSEFSWAAFMYRALEALEALLVAERDAELLRDLLGAKQLPRGCPAGRFLDALGAALAAQPPLGSVIRLQLPRSCGGSGVAQTTSDLSLELPIPSDCGNGRANAGTCLARLLWQLPAPALASVLAALLLERRVVFVGQSRDAVSAALSAAAALLHPLRWQHIYLPLLPRSFSDYLSAPMPFLVGMPAALLPALRSAAASEVVLVDLDLGRVEPAPGSAHDDGVRLPWRGALERALGAAAATLRSPTECESNALIASIVQGYLIKLLGSYRAFIHPDNGGGGGAGTSGSGSSTGAASGAPTPRDAREPSPRPSSARHGAAAPPAPHRGGGGHTGHGGGATTDNALRACGLWFDHDALVASQQRHNPTAAAFLAALRGSQMYEVFVRERLALAAAAGPDAALDASGDAFESRVDAFLERRARRLAARPGGCMVAARGANTATSSATATAASSNGSGASRLVAFLRRHRHTDSNHGVDDDGDDDPVTAASDLRATLVRASRLAAALTGNASAPVPAPGHSHLPRGGADADLPVQRSGLSFTRALQRPSAPLPPLPAVVPGGSRAAALGARLASDPAFVADALADPAAAFFDDADDGLLEEREAAVVAASGGSFSGGRFSRPASCLDLRALAAGGGGGVNGRVSGGVITEGGPRGGGVRSGSVVSSSSESGSLGSPTAATALAATREHESSSGQQREAAAAAADAERAREEQAAAERAAAAAAAAAQRAREEQEAATAAVEVAAAAAAEEEERVQLELQLQLQLELEQAQQVAQEEAEEQRRRAKQAVASAAAAAAATAAAAAAAPSAARTSEGGDAFDKLAASLSKLRAVMGGGGGGGAAMRVSAQAPVTTAAAARHSPGGSLGGMLRKSTGGGGGSGGGVLIPAGSPADAAATAAP